MKKNILPVIMSSILCLLVVSNAYAANNTQRYVIQKGDTLSGIANRFNVSVKEIAATNHISDPHKIYIGQILFIPANEKIVPTPISFPQSTPQAPKEIPETQEFIIKDPPIVYQMDPPEETMPGELFTREKEDSETSWNRFIGGGVTYWLTTFDANLQVSGNDIIGTDIDLENDLGVDTTNGVILYNLWFRPVSRIKASIQYSKFSLSGSKDIGEEINFDDKTYPIETQVAGSIELQRLSAVVEFDILKFDWGYFGFVLGGDYYDLSAELSATDIGRASANYKTGAFAIGVAAGIDLPYNFSLEAQIRGLIFDLSDISLHYITFSGGISYTVLDYIKLTASYRYWWVDVEVDDDLGNLHIKGPSISAEIEF